jgi:lipoyl(octanoyl) transferase
MQAFTQQRDAATPDQLWLLEHQPVFTLGMNGKRRHVLDAGEIPLVEIDRGGQVTYHGPGQLVAYVLLDLRRLNIGVRGLVSALEQSVVDWLLACRVNASTRPDAPGVYVDGAKVAALGLRVRRGCSYHGLALNVDMDLAPFARINPCGYAGMPVTQTRALGINLDVARVAEQWLPYFTERLHYRLR